MLKKIPLAILFFLPLFIISCASEKVESVLIAQDEVRTITSANFAGKVVYEATGKGVSGLYVQVETGDYKDSDTTSSSGSFSLKSKFDKNEIVYFHFVSNKKGIDTYVPFGNIPKGLDPIKLTFTLDQKNQIHLGAIEY